LEQDATLGSTRQLLGALERFGLVEVLHQNFYYFLKKMSFFSFFFFFFFFFHYQGLKRRLLGSATGNKDA